MTATLSPIETPSNETTVHSITEALAARRFIRRPASEDQDEPVHDVLELDCRDIKQISSEDLTSLIRFYGEIRRDSATLTLVNVSRSIRRVFALTRLDRMISIE